MVGKGAPPNTANYGPGPQFTKTMLKLSRLANPSDPRVQHVSGTCKQSSWWLAGIQAPIVFD